MVWDWHECHSIFEIHLFKIIMHSIIIKPQPAPVSAYIHAGLPFTTIASFGVGNWARHVMFSSAFVQYS